MTVDPLPLPDPEDRPPGEGAVKRTATVDGTAPLTITLSGRVGVPARRLASYTPTVGHHVLVLQEGGDLVVLGQIV